MSPTLAILLFAVVLPIIATFQFSLKNYNLTDPTNIKFIGFKNYISVIQNPSFWNALLNSLIVMVIVVCLGLVISLAIAQVLYKKTRISPLLTAAVIIPWALPPIVNGIMWKFIFFPGYGLINKALLTLGLIDTPVSWTTNRLLCMVVIGFVVIWRVVPFSALVFLANMQNIPHSYYEAISLDGANKFLAFKKSPYLCCFHLLG